MKSFIFTLSLLCLFLAAQAKNHAVLVASSNGYSNYGDQGTIFYAYQNLIKNGLAPENIIVFAYDDIANHRSNPFPGQVFSAPTSEGGKDVYKGVKIDYKGKDVDPKVFLNVIQGNSDAVGGRRVLNSTAEDNVFIYINDHGGAGLVYFVEGYLYGDDLQKALKNMHSKKMYKELVFYLDACHSGSMFNNILDPNINIYATTSANPNELAWMNFCPSSDGDVVNGKHIGACISAEYSWSFLSHIEKADLSKETLAEQFEMIKKEVKRSHAQKYGSETIAKKTADNFQAQKKSDAPNWAHSLRFPTPIGIGFTSVQTGPQINSRNKKLEYLTNQQKVNPSRMNALRVQEEVESQKRLDAIFGRLEQQFGLTTTGSNDKIDFACLKIRVAFYERTCGRLSEYGLQYVSYLNQICLQGVKDDVFEFIVEETCTRHPFVETHDE